MKLEYTGNVEDGKLRIINRKQFDVEIKQFEGKKIQLTIIRYRKQRSSFQNRYYWGVVIDMIRNRLIDLGHEVDSGDVHEFLKAQFHYKELINEKDGEIFRIGQSTTDLTTMEFMEYLEKIKIWAAQAIDIVIPEPNTQIEVF